MFPICNFIEENFDALFRGFEPAFNDFKEEITLNDLHSVIEITTFNDIRCIARITEERKIQISQEFLQIAWCVCFGIITLYDEKYLKEMRGNTNNAEYNTDKIKRALCILNIATDLSSNIHNGSSMCIEEDAVQIISELYKKIYSDEYVGKCSKIFSAAFSFVILHECAHSRFFHIEQRENIEHEFEADVYALKNMDYVCDTLKTTSKIGSAIALGCITLFNDAIIGGDTHPDLDERIDSILRNMNIVSTDPIYCIIAIFYKQWRIRGAQIDLKIKTVENCKEFYDIMKREVELWKHDYMYRN